jgi:hypothetical protein
MATLLLFSPKKILCTHSFVQNFATQKNTLLFFKHLLFEVSLSHMKSSPIATDFQSKCGIYHFPDG